MLFYFPAEINALSYSEVKGASEWKTLLRRPSGVVGWAPARGKGGGLLQYGNPWPALVTQTLSTRLGRFVAIGGKEWGFLHSYTVWYRVPGFGQKLHVAWYMAWRRVQWG